MWTNLANGHEITEFQLKLFQHTKSNTNPWEESRALQAIQYNII